MADGIGDRLLRNAIKMRRHVCILQPRAFVAFKPAFDLETFAGTGGQLLKIVRQPPGLDFHRTQSARQRAGQLNRFLDQFNQPIQLARLDQ